MSTSLKKILSSKLYFEIKDLTRDFWVGQEGTLHKSDSSCVPERERVAQGGRDDRDLSRYGYGRMISVHPGSLRKLKFDDAAKMEKCGVCLAYGYFVSSGWGNQNLVEVVCRFEDALTRKTSALKVNKSTTASALQTRYRDLEYYSKYLASSNTKLLSSEGEAIFQALATEVEEGATHLKSLASSDVGRSKVEEKLKKLMVPKRFESQNILLDESLCLIGISPKPSSPGPQVTAAIEAYAIRSDNAIVMVAPAFVYSFLLQQLFPKSHSNILVVSAPAPEEQAVRETTAGVWDPEGNGSLACMQAAIDTARLITGNEL